MSVPIKLRDDCRAADVRAHARRCKDGAQLRRLLAIATVLEGGSRSDAALVGGVTRRIVRNWMLHCNADGPDGLARRKPPGPQAILNDGHRRALEEIIEAGPIAAAHRVVRRRISAERRHGSSGRSAPLKARLPASSCPGATARP
jgi:transposase